MAVNKALAKVLGEELTKTVNESIGDSDVGIFEENMITQTIFDKRLKSVQKERDTATTALEKVNIELKTLGNADVDVKALEKTIKDLGITHKKEIDGLKAERSADTLKAKIDSKIAKAKPKSEKAATAIKALIDMSKVSLDGDNLLGFDSQLAEIVKTETYFFDTVNNAGAVIGEDGKEVIPGDRNYQKELDEARKSKNGQLASKIIMEANKAKQYVL